MKRKSGIGMFQTIAAVLSCVNGRNAEGGEGLWDPMRGKTAKAAIAAFAVFPRMGSHNPSPPSAFLPLTQDNTAAIV